MMVMSVKNNILNVNTHNMFFAEKDSGVMHEKNWWVINNPVQLITCSLQFVLENTPEIRTTQR